jgi:hypothetical protein
MRKILPLSLLLAVAPGLPSCNDGYGLLLAKQVENRAELVGGPVAMADVGDFLLQNDQIRVNILGPKDSPGPGVFGGSIVDVDLRRDRLGFEAGQGRDRFAEMFPVANLLVPFPKADLAQPSVRVLKDGSDGKEAAIRVEGDGAFLFEALAILHDKRNLLSALFPDIKTAFHFSTDYILRPGDRHVVIQTTLVLTDDLVIGCQDPTDMCGDMAQSCPYGLAGDGKGCVVCECGEPIDLEPFTKADSVFGQIFGDNQGQTDPPPQRRAGVVAGDFVFFGNQNTVFAPGIGFDTDKAVHDAFYAGRNTFQTPLSFDFVSAAGGDVSYGYFTDAGGKPSVVNVPLFTSAATAFLSANKSCLYDMSDDADCDAKRAYRYERYLAVGDGDVASVSEEVWRTRKTPTGEIRGVVQWQATGEPAPRSKIYVFQNPTPGKRWASVDELAETNYRATGGYGLVNAADADVGVDLVLDGDYHAKMPPGDYVIIARSEDGMGFSEPQSIHLDEGEVKIVDPVVVRPGRVAYAITDDDGGAMPVKVALVALDDKDQPLEGDGKRRVYLGDGRLGNGVRFIDYSTNGQGTVTVEPGRYRFRASRGPEYGIYEQDIVVGSDSVVRVTGLVPHEVDTEGWMSADIHLHSTPSFDSGMPLPRRLATVADEHVEFAVPTDHDVETDYGPTIKSLFFDPYVATAVGVEETTIEQGHFIGFPLEYDNTTVPTHGSHDPTCRTGGEIVQGLQDRKADEVDKTFTILAHPRDGFFGYLYQLGVDPFTMKRQLGTLEANNPVFETATCEYDGMELINGKRFDLVRTGTVGEVVDWNRCRARIDAAKTESDLANVCPEVKSGPLAACAEGEAFATCQQRARTALAWESMKRILARTPEEQDAIWDFAKDTATGQPLCDAAQYMESPVPSEIAVEPCTYYSGHVDDYFRLLEHGMVRTQIASSDSHDGVHEPGYPRTYFKSPTDSPSALATKDVVDSLRNHQALTTYGPFIRADIDGKSFGETAKLPGGGKASLNLQVQTASWFGVDRIEVYMNGRLVNLPKVTSKPEDIIDFEGAIDLDVPAGRDSWIVVIAMGLEDRNLMRKVSLDIPFGEIQISKITSDAFALIPVVNSLFTPVPTLPDWFPIPAYAVSNPIFVDTDKNGVYDAPLPFPEFCSKKCDPASSEVQCPDGQNCLEDKGMCGVIIFNKCEHRSPWGGGGDALDEAPMMPGGTP